MVVQQLHAARFVPDAYGCLGAWWRFLVDDGGRYVERDIRLLVFVDHAVEVRCGAHDAIGVRGESESDGGDQALNARQHDADYTMSAMFLVLPYVRELRFGRSAWYNACVQKRERKTELCIFTIPNIRDFIHYILPSLLFYQYLTTTI